MSEKIPTVGKVLGCMKDSGKPMKQKELKTALELTAGQVAGALHRLKLEGKIRRSEQGGYEVVKEAKANA